MSAPTTGSTPAGWYPDPSNESQVRWWDGAQWTSNVQPMPQRAAEPVESEPAESASVAAEPAVPAPAVWEPASSASGPAASAQWQPEQPYSPGAPIGDLASGTNSPANLGLTFGLVALVLPITAILGIVFGIKGVLRAGRLKLAGFGAVGRGKAIWGIALSVFFPILWSAALVVFFISVAANPAYKGSVLAQDVTRVLTANGNVVSSVTCDDATSTREGTITNCKGIIDGKLTGLAVRWESPKGQFIITERPL